MTHFFYIFIFVVSRILRVFESLGHEPESKNLQNKQGSGGGVSAGSSMLKLVFEIERLQKVSLAGVYFPVPLLLAFLLFFMKKDDDPFSLESGRSISEMEGRQALNLRVDHFSFLITK